MLPTSDSEAAAVLSPVLVWQKSTIQKQGNRPHFKTLMVSPPVTQRINKNKLYTSPKNRWFKTRTHETTYSDTHVLSPVEKSKRQQKHHMYMRFLAFEAETIKESRVDSWRKTLGRIGVWAEKQLINSQLIYFYSKQDA